MKTKLIRITTVPQSLRGLLKGQLSYMSHHGFEVIGVSSPGEALDDVAREEGIRTVSIKMTRVISPLKDLKALWLLYKLFKKEKPTIVHTHTPKAGTLGMIASWLAGVPLRLHTVAGLPLMETAGLKRVLLDFVEKLTYKCAIKVYPNSKGLYNFILNQRYTSKEKLDIIAQGSSNGIDTSYFSPSTVTQKQKDELKASLNLSNDDFIFIFVGRIVSDKGINELVNAFSKMTEQKHPSKVKLLLVGSMEGNLDPLRSETLNKIKHNRNILAVGSQNDVRPYFAISDCLAFPSYREGFPNVVMQAGAIGLPSIVTDINGCNEIILEGKNGIIIQPKNETALLMAMNNIKDDTVLRNKLRQNARTMIKGRYEQQMIWQSILDEYNKLLNGIMTT